MYFQKTMFVANPGNHQQPVQPLFSTARPVRVVHPAGGGTPGPVESGSHDREFAGTDHATGAQLHHGGGAVRKPKIHPPHPQSRLARGVG